MPAKKSAKNSTPGTKKKSARKAAKKTARKTSKKVATKATGKATKASKPKASEIIRQSSHTPAIFKTHSKRPTNVLFTLEDVREVLKKRSEEEKRDAKEQSENLQAAKKQVEPKAPVPAEEPVQKSKHLAASLDDILGLSPAIGSSGAKKDKVPRKFAKYHKLLIELRDHVRAELNMHSNDTLKRSQKEDAGDISISVDAGTDNFDRDFALSLLSSEQESLKEIEAAIDRIYKGTYGICEVTGETIDPDRLEAVPFTRFSLEGQREYESTSRKRVSRAGAFLSEGSGEAISFGDDDDN